MPTETHPWRDAPPGDYAVVGDPVAHSKSPAMHAAAYKALGLNLTYRAIHVPRGELPEALNHLRTLGYRGVNCTVPHKEAALAWAQDWTDVARLVGAANTLDLPTGRAHNTDVAGFRAAVGSYLGHDDDPDDHSALVLGAGGSAAAVIVALHRVCDEIALWNRSPERAFELVANLKERGLQAPGLTISDKPNLEGFDVIVNATSASLSGQDLGLDWSKAHQDACAIDLAYDVFDAPFLKGAKNAYLLEVLDGRSMLVHQGFAALEWWGLVPNPDPVKRWPWSSPSQTLGKGLQDERLIKIMFGALD